MARTSKQILDQSDELAKRFENFDPELADAIPVAQWELRRAVLARARAEQQIFEAVKTARDAGVSWDAIAQELDLSPQSAQQRYGGDS